MGSNTLKKSGILLCWTIGEVLFCGQTIQAQQVQPTVIQGTVTNQRTRLPVSIGQLTIRIPGEKKLARINIGSGGKFRVDIRQQVEKSQVQIERVSAHKILRVTQGPVWEVFVEKEGEPDLLVPAPLPVIQESLLDWWLRVDKMPENSLEARQELKRLQTLETKVKDNLQRQGYMAKLGYFLMLGKGGRKDFIKGKQMIANAADYNLQEDSISTALYGDVFHLFGQAKDRETCESAAHWYHYAANQGTQYAQIQLAHMYLVHLQQPEQAKKWLKKAYQGQLPINTDDYLSRIERSCQLKKSPFKPTLIKSQEILKGVLAPYKKLLGDWVFVKGGTYSRSLSGKQLKLEVSDFAISKFETSIGQYQAFLNEKHPGHRVVSEVWADRHPHYDQFPVARISWHDAQEYCQWLSKKTGLSFRLPTEKEWEFAALGGNQSKGYRYPGGNHIDSVAWYNKNAYALEGKAKHPNYGVHIDSTKTNELGIANMAGNVAEWCYKWHTLEEEVKAKYRQNPGHPPLNAQPITKGGSWRFPAHHCLIFKSNHQVKRWENAYYLGFRVVLVNDHDK